MAEPALKIVETPAPTIRRFDTADLSQHGKWIVPRMTQTYPHMNERAVATFLQNVLWNNEYLILYQDTGVALAQVMSSHTLHAKPVIYERFVWCENKEDKQQVKNAAEFYTEFLRWAKRLSADVMIVEENTDV